ncbi:protein SMG7 [Nasonia vitripennis]|uniref:Protein SMG7 n=1 Tax=Nasonia vitripennis TaxID=7425 RepID=A0A7M7LJN0_NASVI|nr:protein SMG7 [Nasonia vitripennis]XP_008209752.1 protein SMG7 [Nasonia vitripennis]XP_008209753.1 protein SMG7 [Nasonia vitripennis]
MGLKAAVQALKKAEPLKDKVQRCKDLLNDNDAWMCQRQLQKIYQQVLILDLEYALDRKVEQELWNLGFKNYIAMLQSQAKDRRNPKRGESQAMLSWCLEAASGFYLTLLQEICTAFDLDLPFRRKSYVYGCISPWKAVEKLSAPHKSSCFYACQYCLVHLGDIARYRNQNKQAELFYRHAVSLSPSSGQPYNQLALLEASRGDKLGTVFHYVRSVAVKHPFPVATANLAKTLSSALNDATFNIEGKTKLTSQEYIAVFLKLHGVLYNLGDLSVATTYVKLLNDTLTALVATESFSSWRLVQMLVINLYALQHTAGIPTENAELLKTDQLSSDEKVSRNCILDLIAGSLSALLLPVYTIKNAIVNYFALPTIKLCLDWIQLKPKILEEAAFASRLQIWPSLCVLLNGLQSCVADFDYNQYAKVPLPEDRDLQGFLPLEKSFETLRFTNTDLEGDVVMLNKLRAMRILHLGRRITQHQVNGATLISLGVGDQSEEQKFIAATEGTGLSNELMKELEELSLNKEKQPIVANSPVPSETASSKGSSEIDSLIAEFGLEKRGGILKPQGSLERSRDSGELINTENNSLPSSARKPRQNVAMQAIMRRAETEQKQVTFKNVSPVIIEEDKNKSTAAPTPIPTAIVTSSSSPVKANNAKNIMVSASTTTNGTGNNILTSAPTVQPRPPLMPVPLAIHTKPASGPQQQQQQQQKQLQQQPQQLVEQQLKLENNSNLLMENIRPVSTINHMSLSEMQLSSLQGPPPPGLGQFPQQQPQQLPQTQQQQQPQQQQGPLPPNAGCFPNQTFNVQTPQFNKNFMANPSASLQQYAVAGQLQSQFGNGQPSSSQSIAFPANVHVNQSRLIQQQQQQQGNGQPPASQNITFPGNVHVNQSRLIQQQQQRGNFTSLAQTNSMLTQGLNLTPPSQQPQQQPIGPNMGLNMQQNPLGMHPQNLLAGAHRPVNGLSLQNHMNLPAVASLASAYQNSLPDSAISSTAAASIQQQLGFAGANFGQNNFAQLQQQQNQISPTTYGNGQPQQPQFTFPNQTQGLNKTQQQQSANSYPIFHGYDTKDYNPWKDPQPPQPPVTWWGSNNIAAGQMMQQQQQQQQQQQALGKDMPMIGGTDAFQNWANSSSPSNQRLNNVPLTPGNNYPQNSLQGRVYGGRNNFEDIRSFDMEQKPPQSAPTGSTYSLFSGNSWGMNGSQLSSSSSSNSNSMSSQQQDQMKARLNQQSLWSGPGPSPLERLLEQQKSLREGGT